MTQGNFIPMTVDLTAVKSAGDFEAYPVGEYMLAVESLEMTTTQETQTPRLKAVSQIISGPGMSSEHQGKKAFDGFNFDEKGYPFFKRWLEALGVTEQEMMQWQSTGQGIPTQQLIGRRYCAQNTHRTYNNNTYNQWGRYRTAAEFGQAGSSAASGNGAQAAQPGRLQPPPAAAPPMQQQGYPQQMPQQGYPQPQAPQQAPMQQGYPQQQQQQQQQFQQGAPPPPPSAQFQQPGQAMPQQGFQYPSAPPPPGQVPGQGQ